MKPISIILFGLLLVMPLVSAGCAKESPKFAMRDATEEGKRVAEEGKPEKTTPPVSGAADKNGSFFGIEKQAIEQGGEKSDPAERKIIFTADIQLTVPDFVKAEQELDQLVQAHKGYFAQADVSGSAGSNRKGMWKIRVQAPKFREFVEAAKKLGDLVRFTQDAKEVTEEYYDLQIRIKNKEAELETFRKMYEKAQDKIEHAIAVQTELNRAQRELEQLKGRQRVLEDLIEQTTITMHIQERGPFTPTEPASFGANIDDTFSGSIKVMVALGKLIVLIAVALGPWIPIFAVIVGIVWLISRRRKTMTGTTVSSPAPQAKPT